MTDTEARELLPLYALNALEPGEAAQVEAFIARNPDARVELQGFLETTAILARSVPQLEPAAELRSKVLEKIRVTAQVAPPVSPPISMPVPLASSQAPSSQAPSRWMIPFLSTLAIAASLIAVVLGTRVSSLNTELEAARTQNASGVAVVAAPGAKMYALFDPASKKPIGQVVLTKDGRVFFAHDLGQIPNGKTWQAWAITKDSKAVSLGVFAGSSITNSSIPNSSIPNTTPINIAAFGVSEEPAGGSSQPTQVRGLASL